MSPLAALSARRAVLRRQRVLSADAALAAAAGELREEAAPYLTSGRPDLAAPYLEEAELFESAMRWPGAV